MNFIVESYKQSFFTSKILEWASIHLHSYPWREDRNFFHVFISEFFLQRTRTAQVLAVYQDFVHHYPNLQSLYGIHPSFFKPFFKRLGLMKRLDYFSKILEFFQNNRGQTNELSLNDLLNLPGIGRYTAHAILCFTYNKKLPIVDSNIIRIFRRFFNIQSTKTPPRADNALWIFAHQLLPKTNYQEYNYALIDFGSDICTPRSPKCQSCILLSECFFYLSHQMKEI